MFERPSTRINEHVSNNTPKNTSRELVETSQGRLGCSRRGFAQVLRYFNVLGASNQQQGHKMNSYSVVTALRGQVQVDTGLVHVLLHN